MKQKPRLLCRAPFFCLRKEKCGGAFPGFGGLVCNEEQIFNQSVGHVVRNRFVLFCRLFRIICRSGTLASVEESLVLPFLVNDFLRERHQPIGVFLHQFKNDDGCRHSGCDGKAELVLYFFLTLLIVRDVVSHAQEAFQHVVGSLLEG